MSDVSQTNPARLALVRLALAMAMAIALVISLVAGSPSHADSVGGVSTTEMSSGPSSELGDVGSVHCHCPQGTTAWPASQAPFFAATFTTYVAGNDRALPTVVLSPQPEPPRA